MEYYYYLCTKLMIMRIREVIKEKGLKTSELAEKLGMTESNLNYHISGNPSVKILERIADGLGVPISELFEERHQSTITCPHCGKDIYIKVE